MQQLSEVWATLVTRETEADQTRQHQQLRSQELARIADEFELQLGVLLGEIGRASEVLRATLQDAAVRVEQVSKSSEIAAASVTGAGVEADRTTEAALGMELVIGQINDEVRRVSVMASAASQEAVDAHKLVAELTEKATQIRDVVSIIEAVARQTNFLALNATIEAARAGGMAAASRSSRPRSRSSLVRRLRRPRGSSAALSRSTKRSHMPQERFPRSETASPPSSRPAPRSRRWVAPTPSLLGSLGETVAGISNITTLQVEASAFVQRLRAA